MTTMNNQPEMDLLGALRGWLRGESARATGEGLAGAVRLNRLEPLMTKALAGDVVLSEWEESYGRCLLHGLRHLQAGCGLMDVLRGAGVPVVATRGPFFGAGLYGDVGLRHFTDIDLLVPRELRDRALEIAQQAGFKLRRPEIPLWFYRRHHLHWPLERAEDGVLCDLHWAVDHPYRRLSIDYGAVFRDARERSCDGFTWSEPSPRHQFLLAVAHLSKEVRGFGSRAPSPADLVATGRVQGWLDIAVMLRDVTPAWNATEVQTEARVWGLEGVLPMALLPVERDLGVKAPGGLLDGWACDERPGPERGRCWPGWLRRWAARGGFRVERLADAWAYLREGGSGEEGGPTWFGRLGRLVRAAADGVACAVVAASRRLWPAGLILIASAVARAEMSDAGPVTVNGGAVNGAIAYDIEKDWFTFPALPHAAYTIAVSTGTIWDCTVELRTPDGGSVLAQTVTVFGASGGSFGWTNLAGHRLLYLRVGGFAEFTTGSYQVAVSGGGFPDANGNGMPDAWELQEFGNLTNTAAGDADGDGFSNEDEYLAGSQATNAASSLRIEELGRLADDVTVEWQSVPYGRYRVLTATNLSNGAGWTVLGTNLNLELGTISTFTNAGGGVRDRAFYRVELVY